MDTRRAASINIELTRWSEHNFAWVRPLRAIHRIASVVVTVSTDLFCDEALARAAILSSIAANDTDARRMCANISIATKMETLSEATMEARLRGALIAAERHNYFGALCYTATDTRRYGDGKQSATNIKLTRWSEHNLAWMRPLRATDCVASIVETPEFRFLQFDSLWREKEQLKTTTD